MEANESTKIDDAAARREARRRKILENSKSRLTRITGREHTDEDDKRPVEPEQQDPVIYPDPEIERDIYVPPQTLPFTPEIFRDGDGMGTFDDQQQFFELFNTLQQQQQNAGNASGNMNSFAAFAQFGNLDGDAGSNLFFGNTNNQDSPKVPETPLQKFLKSKVHIAMLGLFTYLLITIAPFRWNIFLVFLTWEMAEIFILRQYESNSNGMVNVVFMLAGVSPAKMNVILKWVQLLNKVLRDVALFMFVFVIAHVCRAYISDVKLIPLIEINDETLQNLVPNTVDDQTNYDVFEDFVL